MIQNSFVSCKIGASWLVTFETKLIEQNRRRWLGLFMQWFLWCRPFVQASTSVNNLFWTQFTVYYSNADFNTQKLGFSNKWSIYFVLLPMTLLLRQNPKSNSRRLTITDYRNFVASLIITNIFFYREGKMNNVGKICPSCPCPEMMTWG